MQRTRTDDSRTRISKGSLAALAVGASLLIGGATTALAADFTVLDRSPLERSLDVDDTRQRYDVAFDQAKRLDVEPKRNLAAGVTRDPELEASLAALKGEVAKAKAKEEIAETEEDVVSASAVGSPESVGVSQSTLDAIASCESGGDPTIVDASGTYHGKYQFDVGTWASVGGSGLPSAAPEEEQDYRAALLYSQAGSTPWPVCG